MASGNVVGIVLRDMPPGSDFAPLSRRAGGSTPNEGLLCWAFDAAANEFMDFLVYLTGYGGGGLTCTLVWSAASATSGACRWGIAIRRIADDAEDIDADHAHDFNYVEATTASASGEVSYDTITFTDGADMDSWANNELAIVRLWRNAGHANDTMTGDAELWTPPIIKET